jgi:hypothetical protein
MPDLRILWTALPRAATATHLDVDVFVSPRLGVDEMPSASFTLADFPSFADWPRQVADHLTFELELTPGASVAATRVPLSAAESAVDLDSAAWQRLFPATTPVEPWRRRSVAGRPLFSFPGDAVADYLRRTYHDASHASHVDPTTGDDLGGVVTDVGGLLDTRPDAERPEPSSHVTGGETTGGGPAPTPTQLGCLQGCLTAPLAWLSWALHWVWYKLTGQPPAPTPLTQTGPAPPPVSVTPKVVTYEFPPPGLAPVPPALAAVEQYVAANGVTPPAGWSPPGSSLSSDQVALASAWRFYRRPESQPPAADAPNVDLVPPPPQLAAWDFHRRLGALGDYPLLLRRLGLVVRLRVPRPTVSPTSVGVRPRWDGQPLPNRDLTPRTVCTLAGDRFLAEARPGSDLKDGVIDLAGADDRTTSPSGYRLLVVDSDGAVLKLVHTAASLVRQRWLRTHGLVRDEPRLEGLAALRGAGVAIVRTSRAAALQAQLARLDTVAPPEQNDAPSELYADDVLRGYHVEVQDVTDPAPGPWLSVCRRAGTYYLLDDTGAVLDRFVLADEGYVKRSAATSGDADSSPLYLHEALIRWTGWSLVAPRPGRRIKAVPGTRPDDGRVVPTQDEEAVPPVPEPQAELHLATAFRSPPGTLPKLRFGRRYRFRVPWVDLAGGAAAKSASAPVSGEITYRRFEPLAPPALLPLDGYTPGESLERLVIRSDVDRAAASYVTHVLQPIAGTVSYHAIATRHVFPPKTSQQQAEEHRCFDGHPLEWGWRASLRADNTLGIPSFPRLDDPDVQVTFGEPDTGTIQATKDVHDTSPQASAINRHDGILPTPYLPDPLAVAVALRELPAADALASAGSLTAHPLPGTSELVCHIPFDHAWPEVRSFRIRIAERPGAVDPENGVETFTNAADPPVWNPAERTLTVFLGKGEVAVVPFSSRPDPGKLDWLGAVDWLDVAAGSSLEQTLQLGCHWLVSPARVLTLVHAVQHPLASAALETAVAKKQLGATIATIEGRMRLHPETTGHVTLLAAWTDETDDGVGGALVKTENERVLDTFAVPLPLAEGSPADTDFPPALPPAEAGSALPARHEFGDPKHRLVRYRLRASTRFRDYFPALLAGATAPDGSDGFSRVGDELTVSVPNSVPPGAPSVRYLVPTFGWDVADPPLPTAWTHFSRTRRGGGARVFLDRPWFTSGPGEQLGAVVPRPAEVLSDTVGSQLGVDPTWYGAFVPVVPVLRASAFIGGTPHSDVGLEDGTKVDVVGFDPVLDVERNQWYADVTLDMTALPSTYWPFVRFAFVRFQPSSIDYAKASKVVLAEFTQLAPDRKLEVDVVGNDVKVVVRGHGPKAPTTNLMLIALDEADVPDPNELSWRPVGHSPGSDVGDGIEQRLGDVVQAVPVGDGFTWERTVTMPGPRGDRSLRVIAYELELRQTDDEVSAERFKGIPPHDPLVVHMIRNRLLPRIVYADSVRLA